MNLRRTILIAAAVCTVAFGALSFGLPGSAGGGVNACGEQTQVAAYCGRCGDHQCVAQCGETPMTCPLDCGGGVPAPSTVTPAPPRQAR